MPDHQSHELGADEGTAPEPLAPTRRVSRPRPTPAAPVLAARPEPHSILPSRQPFFGREDELAQVARTLLPEHVGWGIVLDGPGGIGKTALALEAAHRAPASNSR